MSGLEFDSTGVKVEGYNGTDKRVVIPEGVTEIADGAFRFNDSIEEVSLPNSLKIIGIGAFAYCNGLKDISISESVEQIGVSAFAYTAIKTADINWLQTIPESLFEGCASLESVDISGAHSIEQMAFLACKALRNVKFGAVEIIGESAFAGCDSLVLSSLPESLKVLGPQAFSNFPDGMIIPKSVEKIGGKCLGLYYKERKITIYKSLLYEFREYFRNGENSYNAYEPISMEITVLDNLTGVVVDFIPLYCEWNFDTIVSIIRHFKQDNTFDYVSYDRNIWGKRLKDKNNKLKIACMRLKHPYGLKDDYREDYAKYVSRYLREIAREAVKNNDVGMLTAIYENKLFNNKTIKEVLDYSMAIEATECTAYILNCQNDMKSK